LKNKAEEVTRIYDRTVDYFTNRTEGFVVESPVANRFFSLRKRGSDLCFKLNIGDFDSIYLEVMQIETTMHMGNSWSKSVAGTLEYKTNGDCLDKKKVCLPNKRQQIELEEIIDHVQKSIRPNSLNFILED